MIHCTLKNYKWIYYENSILSNVTCILLAQKYKYCTISTVHDVPKGNAKILRCARTHFIIT